MHMKSLVVLSLISSVALARGREPILTAEAPVPIRYAMKQTKDNVVLMSGDGTVDLAGMVSAEQQQPTGDQRVMQLRVRSIDDGRFAVEVTWKESTADGQRIDWRPSMVLKRGVETEVHLTVPGGDRILMLTLG